MPTYRVKNEAGQDRNLGDHGKDFEAPNILIAREKMMKAYRASKTEPVENTPNKYLVNGTSLRIVYLKDR